ncbi:MAG: response regulator [Chloroflexi bacterium]|nr:response regulator [Chloroflexota bacterium]
MSKARPVVIRTVVADDHALIRESLRDLLNAETDVEVVGVAEDGAQALRLVLDLRPDVLVLDNDMPGLSGLDLVARLRRERSDTVVVMHTSQPEVCEAALGVGACACVAKDGSATILLPAIRAAAPGAVLVVDDEPGIVEVIRGVLEHEGFRVVTAANGAEALRELKRRLPAVVLLDMQMPVLDGQTFVRIVRRWKMDVPIVVMTAGSNAARWARELPVQAYLSKPFDTERLVEVASRYTGGN